MVNALDDIAECAFANDLLHFIPEWDLVSLFESVVPFLVVEAIVYESFELCWLVFVCGGSKEPHFIKLFNFSAFECSKVIVTSYFACLVASQRVHNFVALKRCPKNILALSWLWLMCNTFGLIALEEITTLIFRFRLLLGKVICSIVETVVRQGLSDKLLFILLFNALR